MPCAFSRSAARRHRSRRSGNTRSCRCKHSTRSAHAVRAPPLPLRHQAMSPKRSSSSTSIATVADTIASRALRGAPSASHPLSFFEPLLASEQYAMRTQLSHNCCKRLLDAVKFLPHASPARVRPHTPLVFDQPPCGDPKCRGNVSTALRALLSTPFAFSGVSRRARAKP